MNLCVCVIIDDSDLLYDHTMHVCIYHTQHYFTNLMGQRLYTNITFKVFLGKKIQWMKERGIRKSD